MPFFNDNKIKKWDFFKIQNYGLASPARCMVRENREHTSIVRLFVMHNSTSGSLTNKIGCRNSLTPGDLKNHRFGLLSVNYTGAVKFL